MGLSLTLLSFFVYVRSESSDVYAGLSEPSLLSDAISTKISCAAHISRLRNFSPSIPHAQQGVNLACVGQDFFISRFTVFLFQILGSGGGTKKKEEEKL